jgi:S-(hydroxymethyl)mycothiol dehydrogenase
MVHEVRGVVAPAKGERVAVETVLVPDPGPGEVLVRPRACGVCHTDLHYREGAIGDDFPYLLGHEAAGVVEAVGPGVVSVNPGDEVILAWRAPCGRCRSCLRGRPWYCFDSRNAKQKMTLADGTQLSAAIGIGGFSELTLVAEGQCVPMPAGTDPAVGGLIGCGIMAGFGAAVNTGGVSRGDSVAVFGCGGVGNAAIAAAALAGARIVVGVDVDARKLEWAKGFGATHTVDASKQDPVEAIRGLTDGFGVDLAIEAVGHPKVFEQAFFARDHAGTVVVVGVPDPAMTLTLPMIDIFGRGGAIKPSWYGDALPTRDFPMLVDLHRAGKLDLMAFVSERIGIDGVEGAFDKMRRGEVLRSVVVLPA